jgi:hypothetical protein
MTSPDFSEASFTIGRFGLKFPGEPMSIRG